uniref:Chromosome 16 open reading frame 87 n=1 Tax=Fundulus heteroclitus TaxID=8078 RepID=A0A3Q2P0E6_FUNHE
MTWVLNWCYINKILLNILTCTTIPLQCSFFCKVFFPYVLFMHSTFNCLVTENFITDKLALLWSHTSCRCLKMSFSCRSGANLLSSGFPVFSDGLLLSDLCDHSLLLFWAVDQLDFKRRRTERIRRERIGSPLTSDSENHRRARANSQSDNIRRGRGRPKTVGLKKQEEEKEKQEKEVDMYASLSDEKAFVFSVALAEINRKILGQRLIL